MSRLRKGNGPGALKLKGEMPKGQGAVSSATWLTGKEPLNCRYM